MINRSPLQCCSVKGFVNIRYDSRSVTAFLAVVTYEEQVQAILISGIMNLYQLNHNRRSTTRNELKMNRTKAVVAAPNIATSDSTDT